MSYNNVFFAFSPASSLAAAFRRNRKEDLNSYFPDLAPATPLTDETTTKRHSANIDGRGWFNRNREDLSSFFPEIAANSPENKNAPTKQGQDSPALWNRFSRIFANGLNRIVIDAQNDWVKKYAGMAFSVALAALAGGGTHSPEPARTAAPAPTYPAAVESRLSAPIENFYRLPSNLSSLLEVAPNTADIIARIARANASSSLDFGPRVHPLTDIPDSFHDGWDIDSYTGAPLRATAPGMIRYYYQDAEGSHPITTPDELAHATRLANTRRGLRGYGLYAVIEFDGPLAGFAMRVGHMSRANEGLIGDGARISEGDRFGEVGFSGGVAAGPHGDGSHAHVELLYRIAADAPFDRLYQVDGRKYAPINPALLSQASGPDVSGLTAINPAILARLAEANISEFMPVRQQSHLVVGRRIRRAESVVVPGQDAAPSAEPEVEESGDEGPDLVTITSAPIFFGTSGSPKGVLLQTLNDPVRPANGGRQRLETEELGLY